jgi:riboflavin kinase/FMN adenylyltransferase
MHTIRKLSGLGAVRTPIVLAAGVFDGVHEGHRSVIATAHEKAAACHGQAWVLTFDPHPLKILKPDAAPALLTSTQHKLALLSALGVDGCVLMPFNRELAELEPEAFIENLCSLAPTLHGIVVGENWTFGHRARGNAGMLRKLASEKSLEITVVPGVTWNGSTVSSTRIRQAVADGKLDDAAAMLGRPFSILGTVVHGKKLGRQLGFPTANLNPHNEVRPPPGIYAVRALLDGQSVPGAAYVGGETSGIAQNIVEVHLIDSDIDLYGRDLEVSFHAKLRDDRSFANHDLLREQIAIDVRNARLVLHS